MPAPVCALSLLAVMSVPPFGPWTFFQRFVLGHAARDDLDHIPPPSGYDSWPAYMNAQQIGGSDLTTFTSPLGIPRGRKASLVFKRTGEDVATCGLHFLHRDGEDVADFTAEDSTTLETHLVAFWAAIRDQFTASITLDRITWHRFGVGVRRPNPAASEDLVGGGVAGTHIGTDPLPPQCATSITLKTSVRRNWGRIYLPATVEANVTEGRFVADYITAVRDAAGDLIDSAAGDNLPLVIWCPRHDGKLLQFFKRDADHPESAHSLNLDLPDSSSFARTVDQVQVDDIVDTIRSRRFSAPLIRSTHTLGA